MRINFSPQAPSWYVTLRELELDGGAAAGIPVGARVRRAAGAAGAPGAPALEGADVALFAGDAACEVVAAEGSAEFPLSASAPSREIVCAAEEALALLQRAGSEKEHRASCDPGAALADAQPSRETLMAGREEAGVAPAAPPEDLFYCAAAGVARLGGGELALPPAHARSALGPLFHVLRACLGSGAPTHFAYALVLLRHLEYLFAPVALAPVVPSPLEAATAALGPSAD